MEEKYTGEETRSIRVGIIALIIVLAAVVITISHNSSIKNRGLGGTYNIYASFGRTDGLSVGDAVRLAGVNVGRVTAADLDENFNSRLTLEVEDKYKIPDDSSASIVSFGLIGGKYVEIEVGGAEDYIPAGGSISYTQDAIVLEDLLDRIISMGKSKKKAAVSNENESQQIENKGESDE